MLKSLNWMAEKYTDRVLLSLGLFFVTISSYLAFSNFAVIYFSFECSKYILHLILDNLVWHQQSTGTCCWKTCFIEHERCEMHKEATTKLSTIGVQRSTQHDAELRNCRAMLLKPLETIHYLAKQTKSWLLKIFWL